MPAWLREQIDDLEAGSTDPMRTMTPAVALLPEFRRDPSLWGDCGALNTGDAHGNRDPSEFVASWSARIQEQGTAPHTPQSLRRLLGSDETGLRSAAMS